MKNTISGRSTVVASRNQISSNLGEEIFICNFETGRYYGLNGVGALVWNLLQEAKTVNDIRDAILDEYDVEPDLCERDLRALLQRLTAEELIEVKVETVA